MTLRRAFRRGVAILAISSIGNSWRVLSDWRMLTSWNKAPDRVASQDQNIPSPLLKVLIGSRTSIIHDWKMVSEMQASPLSSSQVVPAYSEAHERAVKKVWKLGCWKMVAKLNIPYLRSNQRYCPKSFSKSFALYLKSLSCSNSVISPALMKDWVGVLDVVLYSKEVLRWVAIYTRQIAQRLV